MGLLRYQVFLVYGVLFLSIWQGAMMTMDETTTGSTAILIQFAPVWGILLLGVYALATILYNVSTFNDCPDAAAELDKQIKEAKAEMTKRKVIQ